MKKVYNIVMKMPRLDGMFKKKLVLRKKIAKF